jgi:hypothetical protein
VGGTRPHPHPLGLKPPVTRTHHPWRVSVFPTPATRMGNGFPSVTHTRQLMLLSPPIPHVAPHLASAPRRRRSIIPLPRRRSAIPLPCRRQPPRPLRCYVGPVVAPGSGSPAPSRADTSCGGGFGWPQDGGRGRCRATGDQRWCRSDWGKGLLDARMPPAAATANASCSGAVAEWRKGIEAASQPRNDRGQVRGDQSG